MGVQSYSLNRVEQLYSSIENECNDLSNQLRNTIVHASSILKFIQVVSNFGQKDT